MPIENLHNNVKYIEYTKYVDIDCWINSLVAEDLGSRLDVTCSKSASVRYGYDFKSCSLNTNPNAKYYNYKDKMLVIWQLHETEWSSEDPSIKISVTYIYLKDSRSIIKDIEDKARVYADEKCIEKYGTIDPMELMDPYEEADMIADMNEYTDTVYFTKREDLLMEFMEKQLDSNLDFDIRRLTSGLLWV